MTSLVAHSILFKSLFAGDGVVNDALLALRLISSPIITLVISSLAAACTPDFGVVMVGTVLATLPTIAVFFFLQRRFVEGLLGSVK